jgi:hypothetical protein
MCTTRPASRNPYIAEHERYYRRHGRVAPTSGERLMARRPKKWMKEWEN